MKKHLFLITIAALLCYSLRFPEASYQAASEGVLLWFHTILPSMLPFIILSSFLIHTGRFSRPLSICNGLFRILFGLSPYGSYAFILGLFCGYPMGAKITADLYRSGYLSQNESEYLLGCSNHPSPMFLSSYFLLHILKRPEYIFPTFFIQYSSVLLQTLILRIYHHRFHVPKSTLSLLKKDHSSSWIDLLDTSIMQGFETITRLGGYIILFSLLSSFLVTCTAGLPFISWLLPGILEITTGLRIIQTADLPFSLMYTCSLACISFGGISVLAQTRGMLKSTPLSISHYIIGKMIHTLCTIILTLLFFCFQRNFAF